MGIFQHPCLIRGIVRTAKGSFVVTRGLVEAPDEVGESLGWRPVDDDQKSAEPSTSRPRRSDDPAG